MSTDKNWFEIDRKGLAKLIERRGKAALVMELVSNAFDADGTTLVDVSLVPEDGKPKVWLTVTDDAPNGFADLTHAYTVFAESSRKADAEKRGRFNLGEKLVLALCDEASIITTGASVTFDHRGRTRGKSRRPKGSEFAGLVRMTRTEMLEVISELRRVITPQGITLRVNAIEVPHREPITYFGATLPTEVADEEGVLKRTSRLTSVNVYEPLNGETPMLYELGVPVVETGDRWHVDVGQKVPLNMDRDNVTPSYLTKIRTLVVNAMHEHLIEDDGNATFVNEALANKDIAPEAANKALDLKYGKKRAIWDPSDLEANMNLESQGYTLIKGAQLTKEQWSNAKRHDPDLKPAGQIAPTKKAVFSPDGEDRWVPRVKWTPAMCSVVDYTAVICEALLDYPISVNVLADITAPFAACFGRQQGFTFNLGRLGHRWFNECFDTVDLTPTIQLNQLIIHELGHFFESNHLDEHYHEALCSLGAKMTRLAIASPNLFRGYVEATHNALTSSDLSFTLQKGT